MLHIPKWARITAALFLLAGLTAGVAFSRVLPVSSSPEQVRIPILMYHHILENPSLLGDYVISPEQFCSDLDYIQKAGYTTVLPRDLAAYARGEAALPEKPIMVTFDDGNKSTYVYAYPALRERGMKGVLAVIGIHSEHYSEIADDNVNYAHATWNELREMEESGVMEIGNHTYNMHEESSPRRGALRNKGESKDEYHEALRADLTTNQDLLRTAIGKAPEVFAYPYGFIDKDADEVLDALGFTVTLGVEEKVSAVQRGDMESLKKLGRFNRPYSARSQTFLDPILKQAQAGPGAKK